MIIIFQGDTAAKLGGILTIVVLINALGKHISYENIVRLGGVENVVSTLKILVFTYEFIIVVCSYRSN